MEQSPNLEEYIPGLQKDFIKELIDIAALVERNSNNVNARVIEHLKLLEATPDCYEQRCARIFARALLKRNDKSFPVNLYDSGISMLDAFQSLYEETPFIKWSHRTVNEMILSRTKSVNELTIVDIGFGSGIQWIDFLKSSDKALRLYAIDLPQPHTDTLIESFKQRVEKLGLQNRVEIISIKSYIEDFDFDCIDTNSFLVVNCALSLHHVPSTGSLNSPRTQLIERIRSFAPQLLTIVEPDSNHASSNFGLTFYEAISHYMTVFAALDRYISNKEHRTFIEERFFGNEIIDIISNDQAFRSEQHERFHQWQKRLREGRFVELAYENLKLDTKTLLTASVWTCD